MQFFMVTNPDADASAEPSPEAFAAVDALIQEGLAAGWLVGVGALDPHKTKITCQNGQFSVTDGPYTEAKEGIVGWSIVKVASREDAIALSKRFWTLTGGNGSGTIQRIIQPGDDPGSWVDPQ
jgi:hypothetical protein